MNNTQIIALVVILLYMTLTVIIGLWVKHNQDKKSKMKSNDDFLMASKSIGPFVLAGTLFAANTGGASTTGVASNVFFYGLSSAWYVIAAGVAFVLVSFIAPYFRRAAANTVPQIINMRYGKSSHIFTAITSISALFMATGVQIIATATIINVVTGFSFQLAAIISTIVIIIYTMVGGYKAVTSVNLLHVIMITVGMTVALFIMLNNDAVGGISLLFAKAEQVKASDGSSMNLTSMIKIGFPVIFGYVVMLSMTFPTGQEIVQTYCSAKDGKSAKVGSIIAGLLSAVYAIVPAMVGLIAYVCIDGYADKYQSNALAQATLTFAPPVIAGLVLSSIVAATMSSASGNMIGTATMFTNDIFTPYINNGMKDDKKEIWISRIAMVVVGLIGLIIALVSKNIIFIMMGAFALRSAGPFAAFICGIFYKNVTERGGFISIVMGTVVAAIWIYGFGTPWGISAIVPGGAVAFICIFVVSIIDRKMGAPALPPIDFGKE